MKMVKPIWATIGARNSKYSFSYSVIAHYSENQNYDGDYPFSYIYNERDVSFYNGFCVSSWGGK